jgi:diacylglycerol kinase
MSHPQAKPAASVDDHATRMHPGTHPSFHKSVAHALHGVVHIIEHERNARLHLLFAALAFTLGLELRLTNVELAAVFFAAIIVFLAETFNTAIERTLDLIDPEENPRIKLIKDMAAGGVLIAAVAAAMIGVVVFGPALGALLWGH